MLYSLDAGFSSDKAAEPLISGAVLLETSPIGCAQILLGSFSLFLNLLLSPQSGEATMAGFAVWASCPGPRRTLLCDIGFRRECLDFAENKCLHQDDDSGPRFSRHFEIISLETYFRRQSRHSKCPGKERKGGFTCDANHHITITERVAPSPSPLACN